MIAKEEETKLNAISLLIDGCKMWTLNKEQGASPLFLLASTLFSFPLSFHIFQVLSSLQVSTL